MGDIMQFKTSELDEQTKRMLASIFVLYNYERKSDIIKIYNGEYCVDSDVVYSIIDLYIKYSYGETKDARIKRLKEIAHSITTKEDLCYFIQLSYMFLFDRMRMKHNIKCYIESVRILLEKDQDITSRGSSEEINELKNFKSHIESYYKVLLETESLEEFIKTYNKFNDLLSLANKYMKLAFSKYVARNFGEISEKKCVIAHFINPYFFNAILNGTAKFSGAYASSSLISYEIFNPCFETYMDRKVGLIMEVDDNIYGAATNDLYLINDAQTISSSMYSSVPIFHPLLIMDQTRSDSHSPANNMSEIAVTFKPIGIICLVDSPFDTTGILAAKKLQEMFPNLEIILVNKAFALPNRYMTIEEIHDSIFLILDDIELQFGAKYPDAILFLRQYKSICEKAFEMRWKEKNAGNGQISVDFLDEGSIFSWENICNSESSEILRVGNNQLPNYDSTGQRIDYNDQYLIARACWPTKIPEEEKWYWEIFEKAFIEFKRKYIENNGMPEDYGFWIDEFLFGLDSKLSHSKLDLKKNC